MKHTIDKTLLLGWIVELCAGEGDIDLLDLIYKLLAENIKNQEVETMDKTFAEKLKQTKKDLGLNQQDVADIMKISKRAVEEWERGKSQPPLYAQPYLLAELEHRAKKVEKLQVELYPSDEDIKNRIAERVEAGESKATYIKRLIREDIAKKQ
jgi:transcriptional regulator with XRE-family HTH domain